LDIQVEVRYENEVGFQTASFNKTNHSLKFLTNNLQNNPMFKEREVIERTMDVVKIHIN